MSSSGQNYVALDDSPAEIRDKIQGAFCPPEQVEGNPVLDYVIKLILPRKGKLEIDRPEKYGGYLELTSEKELKEAYTSGELHPADLKSAVSEALIDIFEPVREKTNPLEE